MKQTHKIQMVFINTINKLIKKSLLFLPESLSLVERQPAELLRGVQISPLAPL